MRQAVILAGGKGTRLRSLLGDVPKALAPIGGVPLLEHQLRLLIRHGFDEVILLVNHGAEQISDWLRSSQCPPIRWRLIDDGEPRGTAGAVLAAMPALREEFAVLYGDTMLNVDLTRFWEWHDAEPEAAGTLFVHPNDHPADSDLIEQNADGRIVKFHPYPHPADAWLPNLVNAALYILRKDALLPWRDAPGPLDFGKNLFPMMLENGQFLRGYISPEYIKDAGTPDRLERVRRSFANGAIARAELGQTQKAVLIDRDGTLNREAGHLKRAEELEVFPNAGQALHRLNEAGWLTVVVTNQPVLARGETSEVELRRIHARLDTELARSHAYYDRLYYCPHHPDGGFPGEVLTLKIACDCRKPAPGLINRARADLNFDPAASWFIGDSTADLGAAEAAGISSILVATGEGGHDRMHPYLPGFRVRDFAAAVTFILEIFPGIALALEELVAHIRPGEDWFVGGIAETEIPILVAGIARLLRQRGHQVAAIPLHNLSGDEAEALIAARRDGPVAFDLYFPAHRVSRKTLSIPEGAIALWHGTDAIALARRCGNFSQTVQLEGGQGAGAGEAAFRFSFHGLLSHKIQE